MPQRARLCECLIIYALTLQTSTLYAISSISKIKVSQALTYEIVEY